MSHERNSEEQAAQVIAAQHVDTDIAASDLDHPLWAKAQPVIIKRYWSGEEAPAGRQAEARLLWSDQALHARFVCRQTEPLVVSSEPQTERKTIGLWERDVCELFIAPDARGPERYFEFEVAPTGEWLDLIVRQTPDERETDWDFHSGMTVAARIGEGLVTVAMRVPWKALGRIPQAGERWHGNLFRCVGAGATRGYLAWRPTFTEQACFHVPQAFGAIVFKG
jgi:hypothetical protein